MKNIRIKWILRKELPYPKLTQEARRRFSQVLSSLPEKSVKAAPAHFPAHFSEKPKQQSNTRKHQAREPVELEVFRPVPRKRRALGFAVKCVSALVVLCTVGLLVLNVVRPDLAEDLPGMGNMFQKINRWWSSHLIMPQPTPLPEVIQKEENGCTLTAEEAYLLGDYLFLELRLDTEDEQLQKAAWLSNEFNSSGEPGENVTALLDGKTLQPYSDLVFEKENGSFHCSATFVLPEGFSGDKAEVELKISNLFGRPLSAQNGPALTNAEIQWDKPLTLAFTALAHPGFTAAMARAEEYPTSCNGVLLENYHWTEGGLLCVTVSCPDLASPDWNSFDLNLCDSHGNNWSGMNTSFEKQEETFRIRLTAEFDYSQEEMGEEFQVFLCGTPSNSILNDFSASLAGFSISPDTGTILPIQNLADDEADDEYGENPIMDMEDFAACQLLGFPCRDHMFAYQSAYMYHSGYDPEMDWYVPKANLFVLVDVDQDLPVEAELYLDGEKWASVPLYWQESACETTSTGYSCETEKYSLNMERIDAKDDGGIYRNIRRAYYLTANFQMDETGGYFWENHEFSYRIINTFTGETLCQSGDSTDFPQIPEVSPEPLPNVSEAESLGAVESSPEEAAY